MYFDNNIIDVFFNSGFEEAITISNSTVKGIVTTSSEIVNVLGINVNVGTIGIMLKTKYAIGTSMTVRGKQYDVEYVIDDHGIFTHIMKGI